MCTKNICPAGWSLPANSLYGTLNSSYNPGSGSGDTRDTGLMSAPLYLVRGGGIYTGSSLSTLYDAGRVGDYWSSTADSADNARLLDFRSSYAYPANNFSRGYGYSVRCVAL